MDLLNISYTEESSVLTESEMSFTLYENTNMAMCMYMYCYSGLPLGGRTPYITSKNRLRTPKLHIKDVRRTSENSLVRPKMDIETSCLQKKNAHIYQIT